MSHAPANFNAAYATAMDTKWLDDPPAMCVRCGKSSPVYFGGRSGDLLLWCRGCNDKDSPVIADEPRATAEQHSRCACGLAGPPELQCTVAYAWCQRDPEEGQ